MQRHLSAAPESQRPSLRCHGQHPMPAVPTTSEFASSAPQPFKSVGKEPVDHADYKTHATRFLSC